MPLRYMGAPLLTLVLYPGLLSSRGRYRTISREREEGVVSGRLRTSKTILRNNGLI